jgi:DNA-binding LytR/AlgR family response regulator
MAQAPLSACKTFLHFIRHLMNILIVEDEMHTAQLLKELIEQHEDCLVTAVAESVSEAVSYLSRYQKKLDLLFFDIQLADGPSFEIFSHIDVHLPVIFCTAYDAHTLQAIKNNGIDYILKPFKDAEIHAALNKYRRLFQSGRSAGSKPWLPEEQAPARYQQSFLTQQRDKSLVVQVEQVALFHVDEEALYLTTFDGHTHLLFKKLEYIESVCDPQQFFRINRQMLVNRRAVVSLEPYFNRKVLAHLRVSLDTQAIVSRLKVAAFKAWLEGAERS